MNTLTKLALGAMGKLRPKPAKGDATPRIALPAPDKSGGMPLMEAIAKRHSSREFAARELPPPLLSSLLWAANVNRADGGRTAPSAMNAQEIDVYVALPSGAYLYDARTNALELIAGSDLRRVTGYQDFVDEAALADASDNFVSLARSHFFRLSDSQKLCISTVVAFPGPGKWCAREEFLSSERWSRRSACNGDFQSPLPSAKTPFTTPFSEFCQTKSTTYKNRKFGFSTP